MVEIECADGNRVLVVPGTGGLMGNCCIVKMFAHTYRQPLMFWTLDLMKNDKMAKACFTYDPISGDRVDLSLSIYADDLIKVYVQEPGPPSARALADKVKLAGALLDDNINEFNLFRNHSKQEAVPCMVGRGSAAEEATFFKDNIIEGKCLIEARALGSRLHAKGFNHPERVKRCKAISEAFYALGAFWKNETNWLTKRIVFLNAVVGAGISGLTAFVWSDADSAAIDKCIVKYARKIMMGGACHTDGDKKVAMSNADVLRYWRILPCREELRVRRLKWYQKIAAWPENNSHVLGAWFGALPFEKEAPIDEMGRVLYSSHPWTKQLAHDLDYIDCIEEGRAMLAAANGSTTAFFHEPLASDFVQIDMNKIRSLAFSVSIPPHDYVAPSLPVVETQVDNVVCNTWTCIVDGCNETFHSKRAMYAHVRGHGYRNALSLCTITNQCFWCLSTFNNRMSAQHHVSASFTNQCCHADRSTLNCEVILPNSLECPACDFVADTWLKLQLHIRDHFPAPRSIILSESHHVHDHATRLGDEGVGVIDEARPSLFGRILQSWRNRDNKKERQPWRYAATSSRSSRLAVPS